MAKVLEYGAKALKECVAIIKDGGIFAFPTETVYGLGANAFNPKAVARIFEVKNRPSFDPIIVHIGEFSQVSLLCSSIDERCRDLMKRFWPGPLTIVLQKSKTVPDIVTAGLPTVAIRMPSHKIALEIIRAASTPIAAPSANPFGYLSPTTAEHVKEQIGEKVDLIIDGGKCPIGLESTVLELIGKTPTVLRLGAVPLEAIEEVVGKVKISKTNISKPKSPGQLLKHYSPKTPLKLIGDTKVKLQKDKKIGLLAFMKPKKKLPYEIIKVLSNNGDLREAAANLFSHLHELDNAHLDIIYAESLPEVGLGRAIMDRLRKASR
ncbi:MAG: L-threonylcarbamoyladenylate synthase [Candidatus Thermoplasmatota archaeon]